MSYPSDAAISDLPFESAFQRMQAIVEELEGGNISLEECVATFSQGMQLAQHCNELLKKARLRIQVIDTASDGTFTLTDVEVSTE